MSKYDLTFAEDLYLRTSIPLPGKRHYLYEYLCRLSPEVLQAYPQKGCPWWLGRAARSPAALAMRDYILHWKTFALSFQKLYPHEYLESLSMEQMQEFLDSHIEKVPFWAYAAPVRDAMLILLQQPEET